MLNKNTLQQILVILIAAVEISSSVFDCEMNRTAESMDANDDSCLLIAVTEMLHLGDKFVGEENVETISPSTVNINRYLIIIFI